MSEEGDLTEGDGRGEEGNTSMDMMHIHKLIKVSHCAEHGKEGRGGNRVGTGGGLIECCVYICLYHPELHQDVRLQCTNKKIEKRKNQTQKKAILNEK